MKLRLIILSLVAIYSCTPDAPPSKSIRTIALGHGGNGFIGFFGSEAPNSIQSIKSALASEHAQGVEVDCQIMADGTLVLYHDQFFESQTHCDGEVARMNWKDVKDCKYDLLVESEDNRLWNFEGLLDYIAARDLTISLDIKMFPDGRKRDSLFVEFEKAIGTSLGKSNFQGQLFIESTSHKLLSHLDKSNLPARLFYYANDFDKGLELATRENLDGLSISNEKISSEQVAQAQAAGLLVMIFGAKNESLNLEVLAKNPDYLQTDDLQHIQTLIHGSDEE